MFETNGALDSFAQARAEFDRAWHDPTHTTIELPPVDVNAVLAAKYDVVPSTRLTGSQVWDMEVKKGWDPATYIPYVVSEASSWDASTLADGASRHVRSSIQKAWVGSNEGRVLEEVVMDPERRTVLFLARTSVVGPCGESVAAEEFQPLFHVEHGVGGTEAQPLNLWRIVLLTEKPEPSFEEPFEAMVRAGWMPGFLEIYLRLDLGVDLARRG